ASAFLAEQLATLIVAVSHKHTRLPIPYLKGGTVSCLSWGSFTAVVVALPSKWNDPTNSNMQSWDSGIDDARMAIEAAGLKVAP
ncbi:hypothetical protein, partial [Pseudomonas typographi]